MALWTQADLDAGKAALLQALQGKTVSFADRSWTSQDLEDLRALVAEMERAVSGRGLSRFGAFQKGV